MSIPQPLGHVPEKSLGEIQGIIHHVEETMGHQLEYADKKFSTKKAFTLSTYGDTGPHLTPKEYQYWTLSIYCDDEDEQEWHALNVFLGDTFEDIRALCMKIVGLQEKKPEDVKNRWRWDGMILNAANTAETLLLMKDRPDIERLLMVSWEDGQVGDTNASHSNVSVALQ